MRCPLKPGMVPSVHLFQPFTTWFQWTSLRRGLDVNDQAQGSSLILGSNGASWSMKSPIMKKRYLQRRKRWAQVKERRNRTTANARRITTSFTSVHMCNFELNGAPCCQNVQETYQPKRSDCQRSTGVLSKFVCWLYRLLEPCVHGCRFFDFLSTNHSYWAANGPVQMIRKNIKEALINDLTKVRKKAHPTIQPQVSQVRLAQATSQPSQNCPFKIQRKKPSGNLLHSCGDLARWFTY